MFKFLFRSSTFLSLLLVLNPIPAYSQWWERGRGFQDSSLYARTYCYGRGDKLSHDEALYVAFMIDKLDHLNEKEKKERRKKIASIILQYIAGNEEYAGCRKAHTAELIQSSR